MDKKIAHFSSNLKMSQEALASQNPLITKMSFVFTDSLPNGNKQGVPKEAFAGIINTGSLMPIKMAYGEIKSGHEDAFPVGVIASLKEYNETEIHGEAALWSEEREEDIKFLKDSYAAGHELNVSWELLYSESKMDEGGVEWLLDPIVRAAVIVGSPAYRGRTPILSVAALSGEYEEITEELLAFSAVWTRAYINDLPDSAFLYIEPGGKKDGGGKTVPRTLRHFPYKDKEGNIDRPHLVNAIQRIPQASIPEDLKTRLQSKARKILQGLGDKASLEGNTLTLEELQAKFDEAQATISRLESEASTLKTEVEGLRTYKTEKEKAEAQAALLEKRLNTLKSNGIEFSAEEVESKKPMLLNLEEAAFDFLVAELKSAKEAKASDKSPKVPALIGDSDSDNLIEAIRAGLKELKEKKASKKES